MNNLYSRKELISAYVFSFFTTIIGTLLVISLLNQVAHTEKIKFIYKLILSFLSGGLASFLIGIILYDFIHNGISYLKKKIKKCL